MEIEIKKLAEAVKVYLPRNVIESRLKATSSRDVLGGFVAGTLVFADISGFTNMSEKLAQKGKEGAEELTDILNRYFTCMLEIALFYGGIQIKFGGDAMLLLFEGERHEARAVRCALLMQKAMGKFKRVRTSQGLFGLRMSIGVNTGRFFEAHLGSSDKRLYYVLTGKDVNRTAEIEGQARAGEVLISRNTARQLGHSLDISGERGDCFLVDGFRSHVARTSGKSENSLLEGQETAAVIRKLAGYLPRQLREAIATGQVVSALQGEHRRVAVIFVNFIGSTETVERFGDDGTAEAVRVLNDYFTAVDATVERYGGLLVGCDLNAVGDKLLIVFGAPVAHEDEDDLAVRCALDLQNELGGSGLPFRQRIGINSGFVFCGDVGSSIRKEYTVMGDHVNLAARLMGVAGERQVFVSRPVYSKVSARFWFEAQAPVQVKGKSQPVPVYLLTGARQDAARRRISLTELVGRDEELALIQETASRAFSGRGRVLSISGPAGVGKSRLALELERWWQSRGGLIMRGSCQSYGTNVPYLPWIGLLKSFFHISADESNQERRGKIESAVSRLCPNLKEWIPLVGNLLGTEIPEGPELQRLDPKLRHQRLLDIVLELLLAEADASRLLLLFEDAQWADAGSLGLLDYVGSNAREHPILVCVVHRPDTPLQLRSKELDNYVEVVLGELSDESAICLLQSLTGMSNVPEELGRLVVDRAHGNPLFVEEVVGSLMDTGYLRQNATTGTYELARGLKDVDVPDTVQGIIMARLDELEEEPRNVLKSASVVGNSFQYSVVRDVLGSSASESGLTNDLDRLASLNMILRVRNEPEPEYRFKHSLTQEVVYGSIPFARRREMHRRAGEFLEAHHKEDIEQLYELLCHHYVLTDDKWKAAEYSVKAGDKAKKIYSNQEARGYFENALRYLKEVSEGIPALEGKVHEDLGDVYELTGAYDRALESYELGQRKYAILGRGGQRGKAELTQRVQQAFPGLPLSSDRDRLAAAIYRKRGMIHERKGEYEIALKYLDRGIGRIVREPAEVARSYAARAGVLYRMGQYVKALDWCRRALQASGDSAIREETAHSYYLMGTISTDMGNVQQAIQYRLRALSIYEEIRDLAGQAKVHNNLGVDFYYQGNWELAKVHYHRSLETRSKIGDVNGTATVSNNLGEILSDQGYLVEAERAFQKCLDTWQGIGYALGIALSNSNLGRVHSRRGEWEKAFEHLEDSRQEFERLRSMGFLSEVYQRVAEVYLGEGRAGMAIQNCHRSLDLATETERPLAVAASHRILGQAYFSLGEYATAEEELTQSERMLRDLNSPYELGKTLWEMALFYYEMKMRGNPIAATRDEYQLLESAVDIFGRLGIRYDAAKAKGIRPAYEKRPERGPL